MQHAGSAPVGWLWVKQYGHRPARTIKVFYLWPLLQQQQMLLLKLIPAPHAPGPAHSSLA
jgi:hypothetical protein